MLPLNLMLPLSLINLLQLVPNLLLKIHPSVIVASLLNYLRATFDH